MRRAIRTLLLTPVLIWTLVPLLAQEPQKDKVKYESRYRDPEAKEMIEKNEAAEEAREAETDRIRDDQEELKDRDKEEEQRIRFDFSRVEKPASPEAFQSVFHFDPIRQYLTGTCWAFSTTSYFESEVYRLRNKQIKLSEMFTVYHEYLEEARRYIRERGESYFGEGSEGNALMMAWNKYGVVPAEAYPGELDPDRRYDHSEMVEEMQSYLEYLKENGIWDEDLALPSLRLIMDKYMGRPPEQVVYEGKEMTPPQFLKNVLKVNLDDYVCIMSTLAQPFHEYGEYEVELNWWHSQDYYNLPLEEFYGVIKYAIQNGYSVRLNGDVSEPGYNGFEDAAIIPTFDMPREYIDQDAREFRFSNESTTDDHDIHLVGYTRAGDYDWFLIKDSGASGHHGEYKGYYFFREDYIQLKMLTYIVHQDAVKAVVKKFRKKKG
ncbi:C1 family peptidase [Candidatus Neomarinimicrobiota bacterium]